MDSIKDVAKQLGVDVEAAAAAIGAIPARPAQGKVTAAASRMDMKPDSGTKVDPAAEAQYLEEKAIEALQGFVTDATLLELRRALAKELLAGKLSTSTA